MENCTVLFIYLISVLLNVQISHIPSLVVMVISRDRREYSMLMLAILDGFVPGHMSEQRLRIIHFLEFHVKSTVMEGNQRYTVFCKK